MMSLEQKAFNKAYRGLAKQKFKRSVTIGGICVYRHPEGLKCAVGHILNNKDYLPSMEGKEFNTLLLKELVPDYLLALNRRFVADLQTAYDSTELYGMEFNLLGVARKYNLTVPEVK